jgi:tetratricopeptide (TPR) repeat protein
VSSAIEPASRRPTAIRRAFFSFRRCAKTAGYATCDLKGSRGSKASREPTQGSGPPQRLPSAQRRLSSALESNSFSSSFSSWLVLGTIRILHASVQAGARVALALDPTNSDAHSVLATIAASCDYDWKTAEKHSPKVIGAESVSPMARHRYAVFYLLPLGRAAEAIEQCRLGLETDPLSMPLHNGMVGSLSQSKQYPEAIECARRALEIDPNHYIVWTALGGAQFRAGLTQEAITSFQRTVELAPWYPPGTWALAIAYHQAGDNERSQEWARKFAGSRGFGAASYYAATGAVDAMFEALDVAYRQRDAMLSFNIQSPLYDPYRTEPRFKALLRQMNLA